MSRTVGKRKPFVFTGWHMLGVMALFFGTVIGINLVMAWNAISSWSGLVVPNSYVASQQFNAKVKAAEAFAASGFTGELDVSDGRVRYQLRDADGQPVTGGRVTATFKRPVDERGDFRLPLAADSAGNYSAVQSMPPGQWIADISTVRDGAPLFHQTIRLVVAGGRP